MGAKRFDLGDRAHLLVECGYSGTPTDTDLVTLQIIDPAGGRFSYNSVEGTVTHSGTGTYYYDLTLYDSGTWSWRWSTTGAVQGADTGEIFVPETVWG